MDDDVELDHVTRENSSTDEEARATDFRSLLTDARAQGAANASVQAAKACGQELPVEGLALYS